MFEDVNAGGIEKLISMIRNTRQRPRVYTEDLGFIPIISPTGILSQYMVMGY